MLEKKHPLVLKEIPNSGPDTFRELGFPEQLSPTYLAEVTQK